MSMREHIVRILADNGRFVDDSPDVEWVMVKCANSARHRNDDSKPSCAIHLDTGNFGCKACLEKGGWNRLAELGGWEKLDGLSAHSGRINPGSIRHVHTGRKEWDELDPDLKGVQLLELNGDWRGMATEVLAKFGTRRILKKHNKGFVEMLVIPVHLAGRVYGYIKAKAHKNQWGKWEKPLFTSKQYSGNGWTSKFGLLGYGETLVMSEFQERRVLFVVEGTRDVLKMHMAGIPSVSILGTGGWSDQKRDFIRQMNPDKIVLLMDGDDAGYACTSRLLEDLAPFYTGSSLDAVWLPIQPKPNKLDPAILSLDCLQEFYQDAIS